MVKQQFDITSIQQPDPSVLKDATSASAVVLKPSQMMIPSLPELSDISTVQLPKEQPVEIGRQEHHQNIKGKNIEKEENTTRTDIISPTYSPVPPPLESPQKDSNLVEKEAAKEVVDSNQLSDFDLLKAEISQNTKNKPAVVTKVENIVVDEQPKNMSRVLEKIPKVEPKQADQKVVDESSSGDSNVTEEPSTAGTTSTTTPDEDQLDISTEDLPRRRGRSSQTTSDTATKPRNTRGSSSSPVKSNNPTDESPKKRRGRPKRTPEPSTSEDSSQEKEKENSASSAPTSTATSKSSDENKKQKILKQKGGM